MPRQKTLHCSTVIIRKLQVTHLPSTWHSTRNFVLNSPAFTKAGLMHHDVLPAQSATSLFDLRVRISCKHNSEHTSPPQRWLRLGSQRIIPLLGAALLSPAAEVTSAPASLCSSIPVLVAVPSLPTVGVKTAYGCCHHRGRLPHPALALALPRFNTQVAQVHGRRCGAVTLIPSLASRISPSVQMDFSSALWAATLQSMIPR